jgi:hypothetical protein
MKKYIQIDLDNIQTSEIHEDGSYTSGIIRRLETKTRQVQDGTEEISTGFDNEGVEQFKTAPKLVTETFSPWDELDPKMVKWLDIPVFESEKAEADALAKFKATRQRLIDTATVDANGFVFDADEISIIRLANAVLAAINEHESYKMQWSLADTKTGVMTNLTLADLKLAHQLAVLNMSSVWGVKD